MYNVDENNLEYDLLKVNVFYNSLLEKTVTDKKDYDLKVRSMESMHIKIHDRLLYYTATKLH